MIIHRTFLHQALIFRKNNSGLSARWDHLNSSLLTIVANQGYAPRLPCHYCQELDHVAYECALSPFEQNKAAAAPVRTSAFTRKGKRPVPYDIYGTRYSYAATPTHPYKQRSKSHHPSHWESTANLYLLEQRPVCGAKWVPSQISTL